MKSNTLMGNVEIVGDITDLTPKDEWLIMNLRTTTPAGWNLKAAMSHADLMALLKLMFKPRNIGYVLFGFGKPSDKKRVPEY